MKFQTLSLLALVGLASAACYQDNYPQSSIPETCTTANGAAGSVMNCDEDTATAKNCDDGGASIYLAPTYCCPT
ncbi:hypothetical protein GTA08_BOTSDO09670 [Botryosphaeria dothidea]|uniref:Uncharacterized protein n=1 Tax=Botryosphaeria dothidea TaxID=55169 RepID=A0A8H4IKZ5_9PEZI|nr:hypothetical protein GTA08_BOTSDO09670 [Botryosphaeria dothidea]